MQRFKSPGSDQSFCLVTLRTLQLHAVFGAGVTYHAFDDLGYPSACSDVGYMHSHD